MFVKYLKNERGLTLIELAGVIAIILIIAIGTAFAGEFIGGKAKRMSVKEQFNSFQVVLQSYFSDYNHLPPASGSTVTGLINGSSITLPNINQLKANQAADIDVQDVIDPYGTGYKVVYLENPAFPTTTSTNKPGKLAIISAGPDGKFGADPILADLSTTGSFSFESDADTKDNYVMFVDVTGGRIKTSFYPKILK